jgi:hypothetical protein
MRAFATWPSLPLATGAGWMPSVEATGALNVEADGNPTEGRLLGRTCVPAPGRNVPDVVASVGFAEACPVIHVPSGV